MPEGLLVAGVIVGIVGGIIGAIGGGWSLVDRINAERQRRKELKDNDYDPLDSIY